MATQLATTNPNARPKLVEKFAHKYGIDQGKLLGILKNTAFKQQGRNSGEVSNEQLAALLVVADQYGLNPFTKEIYAFPDKQNGIVPVVGIDGWVRIVNAHEQFNGVEFRYSESTAKLDESSKECSEWIECVMHRRDMDQPFVIREYLDECYRPPFEGSGQGGKYSIKGPWQSHTRRMLRWKAYIQCARVTFGYSGIYDEDESANIIEGQLVDDGPDAEATVHDLNTRVANRKAQEEEVKPEPVTAAAIEARMKQEEEELAAAVEAVEEEVEVVELAPEPEPVVNEATPIDAAELIAMLKAAKNADDVAQVADLLQYIETDRNKVLDALADAGRRLELD